MGEELSLSNMMHFIYKTVVKHIDKARGTMVKTKLTIPWKISKSNLAS